MWKKLYSNSGLILLAVLAVGVWYSNLQHIFPVKNAPCVDAMAASSPSPTPTFEELLEEEVLKGQQSSLDDLRQVRAFAIAICADGTYSYSASRRGACSRHGGVARWLSR